MYLLVASLRVCILTALKVALSLPVFGVLDKVTLRDEPADAPEILPENNEYSALLVEL